MKYDFPNLAKELLRRYIVDTNAPQAVVFERVQRALLDGDITETEALDLLEQPRPYALINARGGDA